MRATLARTARLRPAARSRRSTPTRACPATTALLSFGIRAQSLDDQQALIERVRDAIGKPGEPGGPPPGVEVELAGLPVIAAAAATDLSSSRYWLTLAGLLAVALVLLAVYRSPRAPWSRWSRSCSPAAGPSLVLWAERRPPQPDVGGARRADDRDRHRVQRHPRRPLPRGARGGRSVVGGGAEAAYARTGAAVLASGVTAIAGFAVLIASDVRMLRDFGLVTVIDLAVALPG